MRKAKTALNEFDHIHFVSVCGRYPYALFNKCWKWKSDFGSEKGQVTPKIKINLGQGYTSTIAGKCLFSKRCQNNCKVIYGQFIKTLINIVYYAVISLDTT